jgi:hypothetical protein
MFNVIQQYVEFRASLTEFEKLWRYAPRISRRGTPY